MKAGFTAVLVLLCVSLAACTRYGVVEQRPVTSEFDAYRLDTGDQLRVTVFGQADLSGDFTVDGNGAISMPLLPPIVARGLTTEEFEGVVAAELGRRLLRNPNVSAQVMQFRPFFILGEVQNAGQYPYVNGMTVQSAAAIAGGYTYRANENRIRITRNLGDRIVEINVDSKALVMPGDTILVRERYF
ncbi:polysaccharide biosynthesis/export family protein [uncultured Parvibaculum sp.]|uniref:polysaccharide biosynthesis/export family protein n=1 Tax=uncultured Parvibaculum sp. TaxID=291828 RepID=UPI0030EC434A|tara:strand:- start:12177 stop:12737 length:561 start_codon:yes stop_codon:yes gene_type:complete